MCGVPLSKMIVYIYNLDSPFGIRRYTRDLKSTQLTGSSVRSVLVIEREVKVPHS